MRISKDLYVYPWTSYRENNCNTVFIDGELPLIIDPGHMHLFGHIIEGMAIDGKDVNSVKCILCTHCHPDHIEAISGFDRDLLVGMGEKEYEYLLNDGKELFIATGTRIPETPIKLLLGEGELKISGKRFRVIHTPGHSPGSICLYWEDEGVLITGDTVFYLGVGRTDFKGGDIDALEESIERLSRFDADLMIPGHGEILKGKKTIERNFSAILEEFFNR
ncbi:MAG: MBL fold metallo-hydrolase [Syntrophorhabdaceae bacterium]|nr:MBL fold metallo-hydrolase [Syntrophorhabdaceae bacterium]